MLTTRIHLGWTVTLRDRDGDRWQYNISHTDREQAIFLARVAAFKDGAGDTSLNSIVRWEEQA